MNKYFLLIILAGCTFSYAMEEEQECDLLELPKWTNNLVIEGASYFWWGWDRATFYTFDGEELEKVEFYNQPFRPSGERWKRVKSKLDPLARKPRPIRFEVGYAVREGDWGYVSLFDKNGNTVGYLHAPFSSSELSEFELDQIREKLQRARPKVEYSLEGDRSNYDVDM